MVQGLLVLLSAVDVAVDNYSDGVSTPLIVQAKEFAILALRLQEAIMIRLVTAIS